MAAVDLRSRPALGLLVGGGVPALAVGLLVTVAALLQGQRAVLGAGSGALLAVLATAAVPGVQAAVRSWPDALLPGVAIGTHVLVVSVVGLVSWWATGRPGVDDSWYVAATVAAILAWVVGAARAALRMRLPLWDTERDRPEGRNGGRRSR